MRLRVAIVDIGPAAGQILAGTEHQVVLGEAFRLLHLLPVVITADQCLVHGVVEVIDTQDLNHFAGLTMLQIHG
jgi:hypothetical protein